MTFSSFEGATETGQPVECYAIELGTSSYRYTSAEDQQTISSLPYTPLAIQRSKLDLTRENRANILEVTVPSSEPFVRSFISTIPGQRAKLTVYRFHRTDTPTPEVAVLFVGYVQSVSFEQQDKVAKIAAVPVSSVTARPVPRFTYQSSCNHVLADARCKVDENAFKFVGTVSAVSGNTITVTGAGAFPNSYFAAGRVELAGASDARLVLAHTGSILTLLLPFGTSPLGSTVTCFAGCAHDLATCFNKFNNVVNFGGFAFVPHKNPFQTGLS